MTAYPKQKEPTPAEEEARLRPLADSLGIDYDVCETEIKTNPSLEIWKEKLITGETIANSRLYFWIECDILYHYISTKANSMMDFNIVDNICRFCSPNGITLFGISTSESDDNFNLSFKTNNEQAKNFIIPKTEFVDKIQTIDWESVVNLIDKSFSVVGESVQNWFVSKLQSVTCSCSGPKDLFPIISENIHRDSCLAVQGIVQDLDPKDLDQPVTPKTVFNWLFVWLDSLPSCYTYKGKAYVDNDGRVEVEDYTVESDGAKSPSTGLSITMHPQNLSKTNTKIKICLLDNFLSIDIMGLQVQATIPKGLETVARTNWLELFTELEELVQPLLLNEEEIKLLLDLEYNL